MADRLYTSSEADEVFSALRFETKLEKATLARIAFVLSLVSEGSGVAQSTSFSGGEMKRPTFIGEDEVFFRTLIAHTYGKRDFGEDEFFSNRSIVKNHIDNGAARLARLFHETGRSGEALISRLVDEVEFAGRQEQLGSGLDIFIGRTLLQRTELVMELNNTAKHANSHLAIMGIRAAYAKRAGSAAPFPDFPDILEVAAAAYEENGKKDDSLIEVLRDLSDFELFWRHGSEGAPMDRVSNRTMLIDVHAMPVLKELVAYLVIERLYKEMATLPDSPNIEGRRTIRTILVIDEAHNYLSQKNIFLQRIIREGRSKGVVVFFASQSPNDYQQKFFNFQELLEFGYIFQCDGVAAGSVQDILGCSGHTARDLQTEIARLEPWQVIARSPEKTKEFVKFTAEAFYKTYA